MSEFDYNSYAPSEGAHTILPLHDPSDDLPVEKPVCTAPKVNWQEQNTNGALKNNCPKHFQPMLQIVDPDYPKSCLKCLRAAYLQRNQTELRD